jgi:hypothetical protein
MMSLTDRPRARWLLVARRWRHLFAFVWLPRDAHFHRTLRQQVQAMLIERLQGPVLDWSVEVEGALALLRFVIDICPVSPPSRRGRAQCTAAGHGARLARSGRRRTRRQGEDSSRAAAIAAALCRCFPLAYRSEYGPARQRATSPAAPPGRRGIETGRAGARGSMSCLVRGRPAASQALPAQRRLLPVRRGADAGELRLPGDREHADRCSTKGGLGSDPRFPAGPARRH